MTSDKKDASNEDKKTLDLVVEHGRLEPGQDPPTFSFGKTVKVGDAATQAATTLGYSADGTYTFSAKGETLDRSKPLAAYHLKDGDVVVLTDFGRAV